jgi:hypothetical protein
MRATALSNGVSSASDALRARAAVNRCRSFARSGLPVAVVGIRSTSQMRDGTRDGLRYLAALARNSSGVTDAPGVATTAATTSSPQRGCGTPKAAA